MKSEWKKCKLGEIDIQIIDGDRGKNYPNKDELFDTGYCLFLSADNVTSTGFQFNKKRFISKEKDGILKNGKLQRNDVVITTRGTVGNVAYYSNTIPYDNMRINSGMLILRCGNSISAKYIYYVLSSEWFMKNIISIRTGTAQPQLPKSHFAKMEISLPPPLLVQQKIAAVLSSLDDKIELNARINKNLEQQANAIFKAWFVFNDYKATKKTNIGNVCNCVLGGTPSRTKSEYWNGNIPWINSGEVNRFRITTPTEFITQIGLKRSSTKLLPAKTTVVAITGATLGQISLLEIPACANQSVVGIIPNDILPYEFIYPFIKNNVKELLSHQTGGAQQHINKKNVESLIVAVPEKSLLDAFVALVAPMYSMIASNCFQSQTLSAIRDTLLPRLMSGSLDVENVKL